MKKKVKKNLNEKSGESDYGRNSLNVDDEVLNLHELFDVQGGVNDSDDNEHLEETCGLGAYGKSGTGNEKQ